MRRMMSILGVALAMFLAMNGAMADGHRWNMPDPPILDMAFPTDKDIASKSVVASAEERADATKWIGKLLNDAVLPSGFGDHMLALKSYISAGHMGLNNPEAQVVHLVNGFLVKYTLPGYCVQVMETRYYVVVGFRELDRAAPRASFQDRANFVESVINTFFKAQPADPISIQVNTSKSTEGWWSPAKREVGREGHDSYDKDQGYSAIWRRALHNGRQERCL